MKRLQTGSVPQKMTVPQSGPLLYEQKLQYSRKIYQSIAKHALKSSTDSNSHLNGNFYYF